MNIEEIRSYRNAQPFAPFDIVMHDGCVVHVSLAERMALAPNGKKIGIYEGIVPHLVDVALISELRRGGGRKRQPRRR